MQNNKKHVKWLEGELLRWEDQGIITPEASLMSLAKRSAELKKN